MWNDIKDAPRDKWIIIGNYYFATQAKLVYDKKLGYDIWVMDNSDIDSWVAADDTTATDWTELPKERFDDNTG